MAPGTSGRCRGADGVFIGLANPEPGIQLDYTRRLFELTEGSPATILVRNNEPFVGRLF